MNLGEVDVRETAPTARESCATINRNFESQAMYCCIIFGWWSSKGFVADNSCRIHKRCTNIIILTKAADGRGTDRRETSAGYSHARAAKRRTTSWM